MVQFLFLIPLNNPQKAYGMDGVVKTIPRRSSLTGIIEEFGFNSICNQTLKSKLQKLKEVAIMTSTLLQNSKDLMTINL